MQYNKEIIDFLEICYGKGLLSPGGEIINKMFGNIVVEGKKILDLGSGLGGVSEYLAKNYDCNIIAVDIEDLLIKMAKERLIKQNLKGNIVYKKCIDISKLKEENFDIIFSKETILHIKNKKDIFRKIYNKLKNNGKLVIVDWFHRDAIYSEEMEEFLKFDGLEIHLLEEQKYIEMLKKSGFKKIKKLDLTKLMHKETNEVLNKTKKELKEKLINRFSRQYYEEYCVSSWQKQKHLLNSKEIIVYQVIAEKI